MSKITPEESLNLKRLISQADDYQDNTEYIRKVKHSEKIRDDIRKLDILMKQNKNLKKKNQMINYHVRFPNFELNLKFLFTIIFLSSIAYPHHLTIVVYFILIYFINHKSNHCFPF